MATTPLDLHPDDVELQQADARLQQEGARGSESAPAPLRRATDDLGVQYRRGEYNDPDAKDAGYTTVADVDKAEPNTVHIDNREEFDKQPDMTVPHELYHVWTNNLPPSEAARIPRSTSRSDYTMPTVEELNQMRASGKTLYDVPNEKAAQMMAFGGKHANDPKVQAAMKPWLDDMRRAPRSTIDMTAAPGPADPAADIVASTVRDAAVQAGVPGAVADAGTINTHPRAPMGPRDDIPGMEGLYGTKHFVRPGDGSKLSTDDAHKYLVKAKGNKDVARAMAKHDNHTF